ncbi:MAG: Acriflavin resistance protein [Pedosphaera sp.]|nr:Acriflavin resistance protein [Pedosphaera sp.]
MSISEPFIRRPVGTSLLAIGLFLLGIVAYKSLPVAPIPRVDFPMIQVSAGLPGADPATVASSLAAPLEKRLGQIAGVSEMTSVSTLGGASITIQFNLDRGVDSAARDVQAAINASASDLPINLPSLPTYRKVNPADAPIMILALTSATLKSTDVYESADTIIAQRLSQVEGVSQAFVSGAEKSAVRVQVNPAALASTGLSLEDVRTFLGQVNVDSPKGSIDGERTRHTIESNDQLLDAEAYQGLILTTKNKTSIKLSSLGKVFEGVENTRLAGWSGTNRAVLVIVFKQPDANVIETVDRIKAILPELQRWIPPSMKIQMVSDRTTTIRSSVKEVQFSLLLSISLVVMVIFLFLRRFWPTFIASVTVPLALAGTFGCMYLLNYSLDNLSLMAITISVGFVVDDAIVVIENVFRFIEQGDNTMHAALKGARQIGFTVVSMSLSLVAVFIPLLFMGGVIGRLFHEFAVTLSMAILVSGVISLTLTPMLCSRFLKPESAYKGKKNLVYRASEWSFNQLLGVYEGGLKWVLRHQGFMLVVAVLTMFATVWLYTKIPKGFFPQQDTGVIMGTTEAAQDISAEAMIKLQTRVSGIVMDDPAVATIGAFIGGQGGGGTVNNGRMFITLKPLKERKVHADEIINRLRGKLAKVEGISLFMQPSQDIRVGGRQGKGQFQYALQSADLKELNYWATALVEQLKKSPELRDVSSDQQTRGLQANVVIDRDAAARLRVSPALIDNTLYDAFGQRQVSTMYQRYNQHHVILEVAPEFQQDPRALEKIYVKSTTGAQVPLASVAKFETGNTSLSVNHQGQFPAITLTFNVAPGVALGQATVVVQQAARDIRMPGTVTGSFQGTAQVFQSSLSSLPMLLAAALIAVYVVLGMLYESLIHPLTIISTLPSAGLGALLALLIFGFDLSLVSFIGVILLMGIVKKNGIMMVDFALDAERQEGLSPEDAIYKACVIRFRPIMMTTLAAMLGVVPLAIGMGEGSELRRPLGVAVVGGLILSQVLTLYTTPVVYLAFEHLRRRFKLHRKKTADALAPAYQG